MNPSSDRGARRGRSQKNKEGDPCSVCGLAPVIKAGKKLADGSPKYRNVCQKCYELARFGRRLAGSKNRRRDAIRRKLITENTTCSRCGFVPEHPCQLDVDHIDGNHHNNEPSNLQVLCANCHRLKTYRARDWEKRDSFLPTFV